MLLHLFYEKLYGTYERLYLKFGAQYVTEFSPILLLKIHNILRLRKIAIASNFAVAIFLLPQST